MLIHLNTNKTIMNTLQTMESVTTENGYINYQGGFFKVLISPEQTNGSMALIDMTLPKGVEPPTHVHTREDETFYLLEGEMTFQVGEDVKEALPGQAVFAPRQIPHHFMIKSESVRFLTLITPGQFLDYFVEFGSPAGEEVKIVPPQGPPPAEFLAYMTGKLTNKYGVLFM
jgi:quercetin dioxygenase-like cupin family protein